MGSAVAEVRALAGIYRVMVLARIRADWQYRGPFIGYTVTQGLITLIDFAEVLVIFNRVDQLAGWSVAEVAFLYGMSSVAFHIGDAFISEVELAARRVRTGTLDTLLTRPVGTLLQICADEFAFRRLGKLVQAMGVLTYALIALDIDWTAPRLVLFAVTIASGTAIFAAIWIITASWTFWLVEGAEVMNAFTYGSAYVAEYPIPVMVKWLRRFFVFVVPVAFVAYFPTLFILGKDDPFGAPAWASFAAPAVAVLLLTIARATWAHAIRHYRSTGS